MKKTLGILSAVGVIAISTTSVIGCVAPKYASGVAGQRVVLATESGKINDHAFNEDAYKGLNTYLWDNYNLVGENNYVEAADASYTSLVSAYRLAKLKKADALVLSGFAHVPTLGEATKLFKNQSVILIDGKADYTNPEYKNVISIVFNSQIASMQAVFDAAYWATTKNDSGQMQGDVNGDGKITFGTFGGTSFKYAVDNYLWGAFLGVELFNQWYATTKGSDHDESYRKIYLANTANHQVSGLKITSSSDAVYYSGNFQLGGATKSGIVDRLIDQEKSDLIFPIAGPQIQDVLSYRPRNNAFNRLPYLIGVDGDQAGAYDRDTVHGRFITSAIKNINNATQAALKHSSSLKDETDHKELVLRTDPDKLWDGSSPTPFLNWSVDLLDDGTGKYQLEHHQLYLYDDSEADNIPNEKNVLINYVNSEFEKTTMDISSYMDGTLIQKIAAEIIANVKLGDIEKLVNN